MPLVMPTGTSDADLKVRIGKSTRIDMPVGLGARNAGSAAYFVTFIEQDAYIGGLPQYDSVGGVATNPPIWYCYPVGQVTLYVDNFGVRGALLGTAATFTFPAAPIRTLVNIDARPAGQRGGGTHLHAYNDTFEFFHDFASTGSPIVDVPYSFLFGGSPVHFDFSWPC